MDRSRLVDTIDYMGNWMDKVFEDELPYMFDENTYQENPDAPTAEEIEAMTLDEFMASEGFV